MTDQPPAELLAFARSYQCGHCRGDTVEIARDEGGWRGHPIHEDGCPVKAGIVSGIPSLARALPPTPNLTPEEGARP